MAKERQADKSADGKSKLKLMILGAAGGLLIVGGAAGSRRSTSRTSRS